MGLLDNKKVAVLASDDDIADGFQRIFRAEGASVDVSRATFSKDCVAEATRLMDLAGSPDIVVNAALDWSPLSLDASSEAWGHLVDANLSFAREVGRLAIERLPDHGVLCSLGMIWSMATSPELGTLGASRAGLAPLTKAWGLKGAPRKIRALLLNVGMIDCAGVKTAMGGQAAFDSFVQRIAMGRCGAIDEVAKPAAFLCSERAHHITGATVVVDGGLLHA